MNPAAAAWPVTAAMVGIGSERRAATTGLKLVTIFPRRSMPSDLEAADRAQSRSKPLEKNLPCAVVMRTEPRVAWDLAWARAERIDSVREMLRRCSLSPVRVRKKMSPRFSSVHILAHAADI